jgi:hypothetical protein
MKIEQCQWTAETGWIPQAPGGLGASAQVVLLFGGVDWFRANRCWDMVRAAYPSGHLFGCTTGGEIQGMRVKDDTLSLTAIAFEHTRAATACVPIEGVDRSMEAGERLGRSLDPKGLAHVFVLSEGLQVNASDLVTGINSALPPGVTVSGGFAADGLRFRETFIWCDGEPKGCVAGALGLYGDRLKIGLSATGGWDPFGIDRLITKSKKNVLYELDGRPALALYKQYVGEDKSLPADGLYFPLELRVGNSRNRVLRTMLAVDQDQQSITLAGNAPEGCYARLMFGNIDHLVDAAQSAAAASVDAFDEVDPQLSILVSCNGRRPVLKQRIEEEIEAAGEALGAGTVLAGFYSYGEIVPAAPGAEAELHNETMAITTFAEV